MKRFTLIFIGLAIFTGRLGAFAPADDPALATVHIKSHGASGTVIASEAGRSWVLGCAHMFTDGWGEPSAAERERPLAIDAPLQAYAQRKKSPARLLGWDYDLDLSLIEIDHGPFHYIPTAPAGHEAGHLLWSCGYDNGRWPVTRQLVTILASRGWTTFTREKPWHGRSGGGLIDGRARVLIGVVQAYEVGPGGRGVYVSHRAVLKFLAGFKNMPRQQKAPLPALRQSLSFQFSVFSFRKAALAEL